MPAERALGIMAALLVLLAVKAGCVAMSVWLHQSAPAFTARAINAYRSRGLRCFVLGAANGLVLALVFAALVQVKALGLLALLVLFALVAAAMTGYMIAYHDMGQRLRGERDWSSARSILLGGLVTETAFMAPIVGQVFSLGVLFRGLGAVISALLSRRSPTIARTNESA